MANLGMSISKLFELIAINGSIIKGYVIALMIRIITVPYQLGPTYPGQKLQVELCMPLTESDLSYNL